MIKFLIVADRKNICITIPVVILFISVTFVIGGCAQNYGRLQRSAEVDKIFITYEVLPDHTYYYVGPEGRPDAIMGVQSIFTLETTQWTQFDPSDDTLKKGVDWMNFHHSTSVRYYPYGFLILDPEGKKLGIWYSIWDWTTVIMKEEDRIEVYPPIRPDPLNELGDEFEREQKF